MTLNLDAVGHRADPFTIEWTPEDAILYALGVGAGQWDPAAELALTTQNTSGTQQVVLPTFGLVRAQAGLLRRIPIGEFDRTKLLHADQRVESLGDIPTAGAAVIDARLEGIHDKKSGALVVISARASDASSGAPLWESRLGYFIRGEGGFGGTTSPQAQWAEPDREPDLVLSTPTRPDQALLYRLSGDTNPLHSDPAFAARAGFERPILHGLCSYGIAHRVLLGALCDGDTGGFASMYARFSRPVHPGATLQTHVWRDRDGARFRTLDDDGRAVLDRGRFDFA